MIQSFLSELDTDRFGFKIAKLDFSEISPDILIKELKKEDVKLIIWRINCNQLAFINILEKMNFKIMDIQVTYKYNFTNHPSCANINTDFIIREANLGDIEKLLEITAESFNQYGHYFADNRLDRDKCSEIYTDWVERSFKDKSVADVIFVAENKTEIAGFLSFKMRSEGNAFFATGVQGAVAKKYRGKNIFKALTHHGLKWGFEMGQLWQEHNVLLTNLSVNRSFISVGFLPFKSFVTMHGWLV